MAQIGPILAEHGQHIFIYGHARTNQIVYSLTRQINDTKALKQLPYLGKQTKPATIRKDMWRPLATVFFPSSRQGLSAYQQLREFRKRHELEWDPAQFKGMSMKNRGRKLRDQKANSIADLAAVLGGQDKIAAQDEELARIRREDDVAAQMKAQTRLQELLQERKEVKTQLYGAQGTKAEELTARYREIKKEKTKLQKKMSAPETHAALEGQYSPLNDFTPPAKRGYGKLRAVKDKPLFTMDGVKIEWANVLDAEFAATWPESVVHDVLPHGGNRGRYLAASVAQSPMVRGQVEEALEDNVTASETAPSQPPQRAEPPIVSGLDRLVRRFQFGAA